MAADRQTPAARRQDGRPKTPLWREAFDAVERPVAAASETWVQSDAFMDLLTVGWRVQRRLTREIQRGAGAWLGFWGLATRADVIRLVNQVAGLERQLRELVRELERREAAGEPRRRAPARRSSTQGQGRG